MQTCSNESKEAFKRRSEQRSARHNAPRGGINQRAALSADRWNRWRLLKLGTILAICKSGWLWDRPGNVFDMSMTELVHMHARSRPDGSQSLLLTELTELRADLTTCASAPKSYQSRSPNPQRFMIMTDYELWEPILENRLLKLAHLKYINI